MGCGRLLGSHWELNRKRGPRKDFEKSPTFRVSSMKQNSQRRLKSDEVN